MSGQSGAVPSEVGGSAVTARVPAFLKWIALLALIYVLICAVTVIGNGFAMATGDEARELFAFSENPFVGLMVGIVSTALIQSSSSVTAIIVALVAGGLPVAIAVPMIMGCNMGTTLTNTIVSLGQVADRDDFRRAFAAATIHDFFNLLSVLIFFPIELIFHPLQRLSLAGADFLRGGANLSMSDFNFMRMITRPVTNSIGLMIPAQPEWLGGLMLILIGLVMILASVYFVGKLMKQLMVGRARAVLNASMGSGMVTGVASGALVTLIVQSSTTTTSLMVPLAGAGSVSLRQVYPFTLGANIATPITAILAATAVSGPTAVPAMQIAFVHFLFNVFSVVLILSLPFLRELPLIGAQWLSELATRRKSIALAYVGGVFFVVPLVLVFSTTLL